MSKTKNKSRSEVESLRGENRQLRKLVKQLQKYARVTEDLQAEADELINEVRIDGYTVIEPGRVTCPKCNEGEFKRVIDLPDKDIFSCDSCDFRKTVKK